MTSNYIFKKNESVRHKILDIIGDLSLVGITVIGKITAFCSGHYIHQQLVKKFIKIIKK